MRKDNRRLFFISYAHGFVEDERLGVKFAEALVAAGHEVFSDHMMDLGANWADEIERQLCKCDFFLLLLSDNTLGSAMVMQEVERVCSRHKLGGAPLILTIRVKLEGKLPYRWAAHLDAYQWRTYHGEADFGSILQSVRSVAEGERETLSRPAHPASAGPQRAWIYGCGVILAAFGLATITVFREDYTSQV